jgi:dephospho-CoA kinase
MTRSGLSAAEVDRIMAQQASRAQRLACADGVIANEGIVLSDLEVQVAQWGSEFGL